MISEQDNRYINVDEIISMLVMLVFIAFFAILPLRNIAIRHIVVFAGSILFYFVAFLRLVKQRHTVGYFLSISTLFIIMAMSMLTTAEHYGYEIFYAGLNFMSLFILMTTESTLYYSKYSMDIIYRGVLIISAMVFFLSFSSVAYLFEDGRNNGSLVLGMTNSNVAGMMISGLINILVIFFVEKGKNQKVFISALIGTLSYLLLRTNCRSAEICTILVILYAIFFNRIKIPNWIVVLPLIISIAFVPIYLFLFNSRLLDIVIMGKGFFSGREVTYREFLALLSTTVHWIFGNYGVVQLANAHNAPLCIMCSFGLVGLAIVYWNFGKRLIGINENANTYASRMTVICFMSLFIQSSMEALMLTGIFPSIAIVYVFTIFADDVQY